MIKSKFAVVFICLCIGIVINSIAQVDESIINYSKPKKYKIGGISVSGIQFLDPNAIIAITSLKVGDEIQVPGDKLTNAIKKLWDQGILGDIQVRVTKIEEDLIFFDFYLKERSRLSKFVFFGIKKTEQDELREKIKLNKGKIVTDVMMKNTQSKVKKYFSDKGYKNVKVNILQSKDSSNSFSNSVTLRIVINKGRKIKVDKVQFNGNTDYDDKTLQAKLKHTRNRNIYIGHLRSKFIKSKYEEDKKKLGDFYNTQGYRDFAIISDTVYGKGKKYVNININLNEGKRYYFRNIIWTGNYKYDSNFLTQVLGIRKGEIYNMSLLEKRLNYNPTGVDVSAYYLDDGYLFFHVDPVEVAIEKDSIDVEMRMYEGPQATINKINISGNTKTNDHVILREIRTKPGEKFSRSDLIRTQREISTLGYFDPEQIGINPKPNPTTGTVDIDYTVAEKPSDQIELSGGWGGYNGFIGTVGVTFNNFSVKNIGNLRKWDPLPAGDGQKLSVRLQANGPSYQSFTTSFSEPWLGGRRPTSLSFSTSYSISRVGYGYGLGGGSSALGGLGNSYNSSYYGSSNIPKGSLSILNTSLSLGRRIKWPDDYFTLSHTISYSHYIMNNYSVFPTYSNGSSNNFVLSTTIARNSIDNPTFPRNGSSISLTLYATPPYSLFKKPANETSLERVHSQYRWVEYYKAMLDATFYMPVIGKLTVAVRGHMGFMGRYNTGKDYSPFERFLLGGNGLSGFNYLLGSDVIGLRGYANNSIGPSPNSQNPLFRANGGIAYDKFVFELRYPITLSQMANVYVLVFAEGGNNFGNYNDYNPLSLKKTVGAGARIFMPAFGLIGVDYGFALDTENGEQLQPFTFTIGQQIR